MSFGYKVLGFGAGGAGPAFGITATGGTETLDGAFKVHTFTANGNFIVAALGTDVTFGSKVEYLVVAGGAGGGMSGHGGGGGAGGYRHNSAYDMTVSVQSYAVVCGARGEGGGPGTCGASGGVSSFNSISPIGKALITSIMSTSASLEVSSKLKFLYLVRPMCCCMA